jgi:hypothetical protein
MIVGVGYWGMLNFCACSVSRWFAWIGACICILRVGIDVRQISIHLISYMLSFKSRIDSSRKPLPLPSEPVNMLPTLYYKHLVLSEQPRTRT